MEQDDFAVIRNGFVVLAIEYVGVASVDDVGLVERVDLYLFAEPADLVLVGLVHNNQTKY